MKRHQALICLALLSVLLGACGSDESPTTTETFTPQQLSEALLTTSDLGAGWTETQRDVFTSREPENPSIDPSLWCPAARGDELVALARQGGADVELTVGTPASPYIVRQQAWSNANVEQYLTAVKAAVASCSGVTWTDDGGNSYTLQAPRPAPSIGDESISWTVTIQLIGSTPAMSFTDQTAARFANVAMVLQAGATPGPEAFAPNYVIILRAARDKMAGLFTQ